MSIELNGYYKPGPSQQDNELWISMAKVAYPSLSLLQLRTLRDEAVMEWALDYQSEKAKLYEQYYMVKKLKQS